MLQVFLEQTSSLHFFKTQMTIYHNSVYHAQINIKKAIVQEPMFTSYGVLRFRQEFDRLMNFYWARTKKLKHAAKIVSHLNDYDLKEAQTWIQIEGLIDQFRKRSRYKFYLMVSEKQWCQYQIYYKYYEREEPTKVA